MKDLHHIIMAAMSCFVFLFALVGTSDFWFYLKGSTDTNNSYISLWKWSSTTNGQKSVWVVSSPVFLEASCAEFSRHFQACSAFAILTCIVSFFTIFGYVPNITDLRRMFPKGWQPLGKKLSTVPIGLMLSTVTILFSMITWVIGTALTEGKFCDGEVHLGRFGFYRGFYFFMLPWCVYSITFLIAVGMYVTAVDEFEFDDADDVATVTVVPTPPPWWQTSQNSDAGQSATTTSATSNPLEPIPQAHRVFFAALEQSPASADGAAVAVEKRTNGPTVVLTKRYKDQKPGTSGLRKKVTVFQQDHYLANFVQATFDALAAPGAEGIPEVLVVGGDGRYWCPEAAQLIVKMAAANGVKRVWVGQNALLSTPAVSAIVRTREGGFVAKGAFILTASHNPGGPTEDFGIKYNCGNGGPAPEKLTGAIFDQTLAITQYKICNDIPNVDLTAIGTTKVSNDFSVEVIDCTEDYVKLLFTIFDLKALRKLVKRHDFTFLFDGMHGVAGPYAKRVFLDLLGADASNLINCEPKTDFGKGHPDPNLTYAPQLVKAMGLNADGTVNTIDHPRKVPDFGAASDGDADRNMILGKDFFVTPSDSVAVIAAQSKCIPFFAKAGGVKSVARSMPTSGALDRVAEELKIPMFEVPTGWKFFGNLMDSKDVYGKTDYNPLICGEESFGTGSNHVREKDGLWAVLAWMSILAEHNKDDRQPFVPIRVIVTRHWERFGRNYYRRYDYEGVDTEGANQLMDLMRAKKAEIHKIPRLKTGAACKSIDDFAYLDPVDGSVSKKQGIRVLYEDGSRFVFRLSGTGSVGATIRLYMEQYMNPEQVKGHLQRSGATYHGKLPEPSDVLENLSNISVQTSQLEALTGRKEPTVIT